MVYLWKIHAFNSAKKMRMSFSRNTLFDAKEVASTIKRIKPLGTISEKEILAQNFRYLRQSIMGNFFDKPSNLRSKRTAAPTRNENDEI
jgi:hypothetical protein